MKQSFNNSVEYLKMVDSICISEIPPEVMSKAKRSLLDYFAVTCAGATFQKERIGNYYKFSQPDKGSFTVIGTEIRTNLKEAVFLNGLNSHALDYDDGTNSGIIHLGSPIFSLLIPLAQRYEVSLGKMLKAAIIGYEASYTMAISIQPDHKALGFHATGTCGTLGAVIAASYMLDFSEEERRNAFSAACVSASGVLKVLDDGSELKPYNVAKSSLLALTSIEMAKAGFKGSPDPLGGDRGFLKMMTGRDDIELMSVLHNGTYAIMKSYTKPYASCRYTHPSIEAAINLINQYDIHIEDITSIEVLTYDLAVRGHDHTDIPGSYSAKMSIPYSVAVALVFRKAGLQEFEEAIVSDETVRLLTKKVTVNARKDLSKLFPETQTAILTINTHNGSYTNRVDYPKGEPENPMTEEEYKERYDALMKYAEYDPAISDEIYRTVLGSDKKVSSVIDLL